MFGPDKMMKWFDGNLQIVRRWRRKTLAHIVGGAMPMKGVGVLNLGRAMAGPTTAKHRIKRVDRFLGNKQIEFFPSMKRSSMSCDSPLCVKVSHSLSLHGLAPSR